jgi:hypothetical protein
VSDLFSKPDAAATPLTPEEMHGLIPTHIAFRRELNRAEQDNILRGQSWALGRNRDPLTEKYILELHRRMLGDVWRWAGKFLTTGRNIGIEYRQIPVALRQLLDEARAWIDYKQDLSARGDRCALPSPAGADTPFSYRQRTPFAAYGGPIGDAEWRRAVYMGTAEPTRSWRRADLLHRRPPLRRPSRNSGSARLRAGIDHFTIRPPQSSRRKWVIGMTSIPSLDRRGSRSRHTTILRSSGASSASASKPL